MRSAFDMDARLLLDYLRLEGVGSVMRLVSLARTGSMRATSVETGVSFNRLRGELDKLEDVLGLKLFRRTSTGLVITEAGKKAVAIGLEIDAQLVQITLLSQAFRDKPSEVLIATSEGLGAFWLLPQLSAGTGDKAQQIKLKIGTDVPDVSKLEADISIQFSEPDSPELVRGRLATMHLMLAASPAYLSEHGEPKSLKDFAHHRFVDQSDLQLSDRSILDMMIGQDDTRNYSVVVNSSFAQVLAAENGMGIIVVPSYFAILGGRLKAISVTPTRSVPIWICYRRDAMDLAHIRSTIDWLKQAFNYQRYPWFRREFVAPDQFEAEIGAEALAKIMRLHSVR